MKIVALQNKLVGVLRLFGPEKISGLSRTGPQKCSLHQVPERATRAELVEAWLALTNVNYTIEPYRLRYVLTNC